MKSDKYGERRGAAFGLAGVVKGFGISSLKKYGIVTVLREGLADRYLTKTSGSVRILVVMLDALSCQIVTCSSMSKSKKLLAENMHVYDEMCFLSDRHYHSI